MPLKIVALTESLAIAPQITAGDVQEIAAKGYRAIINNRPDDEEPGQLLAEEAQSLAEAAGLVYEYLPITAATLTADQIEAFDRMLSGLEGPVLAHCRSGTRCYLLWAAVELRKNRQSADTLIRQAADRGFDISVLKRFA